MTDRSVAALLLALAILVGTAPAVSAQDLPRPEPTPEESRRAADEILARPEYQEPEPSTVERALDWLREQLRRAEPRPRRSPAGSASAPSGDASFLAWFVVVLLVVLLVVVLSRLRPGARRRRKQDDPLELSETELGRAADEWLAEAERLEGQEQWKAALRARFRALIGALIDRGVVRDLPGRTSGEYRSEVRRAAPELAGDFAEASYLFDDAWYGDLPTGRSENAAFRQLAARVLEGARSAPPAGARQEATT